MQLLTSLNVSGSLRCNVDELFNLKVSARILHFSTQDAYWLPLSTSVGICFYIFLITFVIFQKGVDPFSSLDIQLFQEKILNFKISSCKIWLSRLYFYFVGKISITHPFSSKMISSCNYLTGRWSELKLLRAITANNSCGTFVKKSQELMVDNLMMKEYELPSLAHAATLQQCHEGGSIPWKERKGSLGKLLQLAWQQILRLGTKVHAQWYCS